MADVDIAVGIRRSVVQHVAGAAGARGADFFVEVIVLPLLQALGLALREIAAHRKAGIR